ncbi:hypothetical protein [Marinomonas sp. MED121]|uniref:calcium-binding protein n=1 Tax=Marinomonas sp. MED121 TaxID=314277 RepID=UPI0002DB6CCD|nr:hypothetical protein [Marinomonas sp. MED121]
MAYTDNSYWNSISYSNTTNYDDSEWGVQTKTLTASSNNDKYTGFDDLEFVKTDYVLWEDYYENPNLNIYMGEGDDWLSFDINKTNSSDFQDWHNMDLYVELGTGHDYFYLDSDGDHSSDDVDIYLTLDAGEGDDYVYFDSNDNGSSTVIGGAGSDYIKTKGTNDVIYGDYDDSTAEVSGYDYDDIISSGGGSDTIEGGYGDDYIDGGDGADTINGGDGDDIIVGGSINSSGVDELTGGEGNDIFVVSEWATDGTSENPFGADWGIWRGVYTGADVISTIGTIAGVTSPVASFFMGAILSNGANALATWLTAADDSSVELDASDSTYSDITDFNMQDDLLVLPTIEGISFSADTTGSGTDTILEFDYDGGTGTFLKLAFEGQETNSSATGFYAEFLDAIGEDYNFTDQDTLAASFAEVMLDSIVILEEDDSGNITITQNGHTETYTDSELDEYYSTNWSSLLADDTSIMLLGADFGYTSEFTASTSQYISGGYSTDAFFGAQNSGARAYVASFDGSDLYNHKDNDFGFYFNGGEGNDTISFDGYEGSSGVTIDLSTEAQAAYGSVASGNDSDEDENITLVSVENIIGTAYDDHLTGNEDANLFAVGGIDDGIDGGGDDTIIGGYGYDTVYLDTKIQYYTLTSMDLITEDASGDETDMTSIEFLQFDGRGSERYAYSSDTNTMSVYSVDSEIVDASYFSDWVFSNETGEKLRGRGEDDHFIGAGGDDTIYGDGETWDSGNTDTAYYLGGVASYFIDYVSDTDLETTVEDLNTTTHDEGTDTLYNVEILSFADGVTIDLSSETIITGDDSGTQIGGLNTDAWIFAGAGDDTLYGWLGDDHIIGGEGDDYINGCGDDDTAYYAGGVAGYLVESISDTQLEIEDIDTANYDEGTDTIIEVETLSFGDGASIDLSSDYIVTGTSQDDTLFGSNQDEDSWLFGGDGDDTLSGLYGDDHFIGGEGDDIVYGMHLYIPDDSGVINTAYYAGSIAEYLVDSVSDTYYETTIEDLTTSDYDEGTDTTYYVEKLSFGDGATIDLTSETIKTGSDSADILHGEDDAAWLFAGEGNDTLYGWKGDDHLIGGEGDDAIYGGSNNYNNSSDLDTAYYADVIDNYDITVWQDDSGNDWATIEDVGNDGYDEGLDTLKDIDSFVFAGTEYSILDLAGMAA